MHNVQEAVWVPGPVWTGAENLAPTGSSTPNRPAIPTTLSELIIIILVITFMRDIYNYTHETNHASRVYSVAAVLYLQSMLHVMLFPT